MSDPTAMVPVMFVLVGGVFAVTGLLDIRSEVVFHRRAVRCRGVVTDFDVRRSSGVGDSSGSTIYYPILEFRTSDGRDVRTTSRFGKSWRGCRAGEEVDVSYDPRDPSHAYLGSGASATVLSVLFTVFGSVSLAVGLNMLISRGVLAHLFGGA